MCIEKIIEAMHEVFIEIPYGIDHTMKVLKNAEAIMDGEGIDGEERELISIVAILHDIGAVEALRKYGSIDGIYQEMEGPAVARDILDNEKYELCKIDRICYIIGNHHTPAKIDGLDFQIQWEADLIENLLGTNSKGDNHTQQAIIENNFKTASGKALAIKMLL